MAHKDAAIRADYQHDYYERHREQRRAYHREYYKNHRDEHLENLKRRLRFGDAVVWVGMTRKQRKKLMEGFNNGTTE